MSSFSLFVLLFLGFSQISASQDGYGEVEDKEWEDMWTQLLNDIKNNPEYAEDFQRKLDIYSTEDEEMDPTDIKFECEIEDSDTRPTSVHRLRPSDIQIIAALGDSITASFGLRAQTLPAVIMENRGESWSVGSERSLNHGVITLANILRKFNPNLQGSSICNRYHTHPYMNWFNVAVSGATSLNMEAQTWNLIHRLRADESIDFNNDWKLITVLLGGNDLCRWCLNAAFLPENYANNVKKALDIMQDNIPNAMVNLVVMLDVGVVNHVNHSDWCGTVHSIACPCALGENRETTSQYTVEYYQQLKNLVDSGRYDQWDDFTVVLQPHMRDLYPDVLLVDGEVPQDLFAPDCFHPSQTGHQLMAVILWSAMMTPVGEKPYKFFPHELLDTYKCPSKEQPYIFTNLNSFGESITSSGRLVASATIAVTLLFNLW